MYVYYTYIYHNYNYHEPPKSWKIKVLATKNLVISHKNLYINM